MEFKKKILDNGLTIIGEVNKSAKSAAVGFFVRTGSRDETAQISGVSHFLEHMLFKGTEKLDPLQVNQAFDKTGAQFNAFTSEENTVYYAAVLPEYLAEVTNLWIELMRPALRDEDFNMEKNVIKEEIAMYKDMPHFDVLDKGRSLYFDNHPCGQSVLGSVESIDALTAQQMREYFNNRYAPNNMVLAFVGNFDWENVCALAEKSCRSWQAQPVERKTQPFGGSKKTERITKQNLACEHICLVSPGVSMQDERRFAASMLAAIIGDDNGSRFFWELVDNALAETASMQCEAMDGTGAFYSYIRCTADNSEKVLGIVRSIFENLYQKGVTEQELQKARNKILSALVIKNELPMGRLVSLGFNWIYLQEYQAVNDDVQNIKSVTLDDVNNLIKQMNPGNFTKLSLTPAL
ncbi:MAG: pitrilysin family protein [Phycisphaerae bacterium]